VTLKSICITIRFPSFFAFGGDLLTQESIVYFKSNCDNSLEILVLPIVFVIYLSLSDNT